MVVWAANGVFVYCAVLALYVVGSGARADTLADRFGKLFGFFWMWTFVVVPAFAVLVGWRVARDVDRRNLGLFKGLWRPTLEGVAFGLALGLGVFLSAVGGATADLDRPGGVERRRGPADSGVGGPGDRLWYRDRARNGIFNIP
jgi:hypothetical protein